MNHTKINEFIQHPLKSQLREMRIRQYDLAASLQIQESVLSKMLSGIAPMPKSTEEKIRRILNFHNRKNN